MKKVIFIPIIFMYSCAQIVPLSGGEKDTIPPKEVKSEPTNQSVNFTTKNIEVEFDEFIQLQNLNKQLLISPLIKNTPEIFVRGKKLIIHLKDSLKLNTTYSINFGNAITDITENNAYPNYKYVFSTGNFMDSLSYSGTVYDAFDLTPQKDVYILLYTNLEDSVPLKQTPDYIAITDQDGKFNISNIAIGKYKIFALKDINSNYLYDLPNEKIGFKNKFIEIDSNIINQNIFLFEEDSALQFVKKADNQTIGKINIILNKSVENVTLNILKPSEKIDFLWQKNRDENSIVFWLKDIKNSPNSLTFQVIDDAKIVDTVEVSLLDKKLFKDSILSLHTNITPVFDLNNDIKIITERPINNLDTSKILLIEDSIPVKFIFKNDSLSPQDFYIHYPFKEATSYWLKIKPTAFTGIYGSMSDTLIQNFTTKKASDYGNIMLSFKPEQKGNYILQLYNHNKLLQTSYYKEASKINYDYLAPGDYQLKLIIDSNNNKKWDSGNYLKHLQPEKVIYYDKPIKIRSNWDNEINWVLKE